MSDNVLMIGIAEIRLHLKGIDGLEDRFSAACRQAHELWVTGDDEARFKAAVAATILETSDPIEKDRLVRSTEILKAMSAAMSGIPVDFDRAIPDSDFEPLPLLGIWHETRGTR